MEYDQKSEVKVEIKDVPIAVVNGRVIDPFNNRSGNLNIFIDKGKIVEVCERPAEAGMKVIDAGGMIVAPGFIDLHTHLRDPGFEYKEDIRSGAKAALAGGFTTILCMPNTNPVCDNKEVVQYIIKKSSDIGLARVIPVGAISEGLEGKKAADIAGMADTGVLAISDDGSCVQDNSLMLKACQSAKERGVLVIDHAEDISISKDGVMNEGDLSKRYQLPGIPRESETSIIERDVELAKKAAAHLHIAHVSTAEGVEMIRRAKAEGVPVTCEAAPHHLVLTEDAISQYGPNAKMKPPLRLKSDMYALREGLADGTIDAIATDHAPHAGHEKIDMSSAAFGIIGMETALPVCMRLVEEGWITLERLIELFTSSPAKVISPSLGGMRSGEGGLAGCGTLSINSPADLTIFSTNETFKIASRLFRSKSRNTPFEGWEVRGKVQYTIVGGRVVFKS